MPKNSKVRTEQICDLIDMYNEGKRENKKLKEEIEDYKKLWETEKAINLERLRMNVKLDYENKQLKENEKEIAKKWFLIGLSHSIILFDPGKKDFKKVFDESWENEKKKEGQQTTIRCEWCSSMIPPFTKLKEGNGFICKRCYEE